MNTVILLGNITRDPELRNTPKGTPICQFGIAVNEAWKDSDGSKRESVMFVDCQAWGKAGENIAKFFTKGRKILITGKLVLNQWDDKTTGAKRSKHEVNVQAFHFADSKGERSNDAPASGGKSEPRPAAPENDEDVPF